MPNANSSKKFQDMGAVAVDMANEMRELPVTSTVRIMVMLTGITFLPGLLLR